MTEAPSATGDLLPIAPARGLAGGDLRAPAVFHKSEEDTCFVCLRRATETNNKSTAGAAVGDLVFQVVLARGGADPCVKHSIPVSRILNVFYPGSHGAHTDNAAAAALANTASDLGTEASCLPSSSSSSEAARRRGGAGSSHRFDFSVLFLPRGAKGSLRGKVQALRFAAKGSVADAAALVGVFRAVRSAVYPRGPLRITAFVSPKSGSGEAQKLWDKYCAPVLGATDHTVQVITTTHQRHAEEWCAAASDTLSALETLKYLAAASTGPHTLSERDLIVAVGGDGMAHEVVNGLMQRRARLPATARTPLVATFPAGSGCALAKTLGVIDFVDAALALVGGATIGMDLMRLEQRPTTRLPPRATSKKQQLQQQQAASVVGESITPDPSAPPRYAFLNLGLAIIAHIDRGSEKYRWMGNARFTAYGLECILGGVPTFRYTVRYKPSVSSVTSLAADRALPVVSAFADVAGTPYPGDRVPPSASGSPTPLQPAASPSTEPVAAAVAAAASADSGWVTLPERDFVLLGICNMPWIARDMRYAPYAAPDDGTIDIVYRAGAVSRAESLKCLVDIEDGSHIRNQSIGYIKASAVLVEPHEGLMMADGEVVPFTGIEATAVPRALMFVCAPSALSASVRVAEERTSDP